ncbi:MAG: hypothetical protein GF405_03130 [Candidatus Eisenbacteria bacterium]|nr:hypothetical protein [Candidatus Eisenbacteria bacterium]
MSRSLATAMVILLMTCGGSGMPADVPLEDLVRDSDLVVAGTLRSVSASTRSGVDVASGIIDVADVLWGDAAPGDTLRLVWKNQSGLAHPRVEYAHFTGREVVWLLTTRSDGTIRADHPACASGSPERVEKALRSARVLTRWPKYRFRVGGPVEIGYRNAAESPMLFPGIVLEDGALVVDPSVRIALTAGRAGTGVPVPPRKGRLIRDPAIAPVRVPPGSQWTVTVDLNQLYPLGPAGTHHLTVDVDDNGPPDRQWFEMD